jgi:hypothetical protein
MLGLAMRGQVSRMGSERGKPYAGIPPPMHPAWQGTWWRQSRTYVVHGSGSAAAARQPTSGRRESPAYAAVAGGPSRSADAQAGCQAQPANVRPTGMWPGTVRVRAK